MWVGSLPIIILSCLSYPRPTPRPTLSPSVSRLLSLFPPLLNWLHGGRRILTDKWILFWKEQLCIWLKVCWQKKHKKSKHSADSFSNMENPTHTFRTPHPTPLNSPCGPKKMGQSHSNRYAHYERSVETNTVCILLKQHQIMLSGQKVVGQSPKRSDEKTVFLLANFVGRLTSVSIYTPCRPPPPPPPFPCYHSKHVNYSSHSAKKRKWQVTAKQLSCSLFFSQSRKFL